MRKTLAATATTTMLMLVGAAPAMAGLMKIAGGSAIYSADPGEANNLTVDFAGNEVIFNDVVPVTDGDGAGGCTASGNQGRCPLGADLPGQVSVSAFLDDLDDRFQVTPAVPTDFFIGAEGEDGNDTLIGHDGRNDLEGGAGNDTLDGRAGDDNLAGGTGADNHIGGDGLDEVDYGQATGPVTVSLNGIADDGQQGEGDNVNPDVELVEGGDFNDLIIGNDGPNFFSGDNGNDRLVGLGGNDELDIFGAGGNDALEGGDGDDVLGTGAAGFGVPSADGLFGGPGEDTLSYAARDRAVIVTQDDAGNDGEAGEGDNVASDVENISGGSGDDSIAAADIPNSLSGNRGNDTIDGGGGSDDVDGGNGADALTGGGANDIVEGRGGDDRIFVRDGVNDRASCGAGNDAVQADRRDDVEGGCEAADIPAPLAVAIARRASSIRTGFIRVRLACPAEEVLCEGTVTLVTVRRFARLGRIELEDREFRIRGGTSQNLRVPVPAKALRPLARARRVAFRVTATVRDDNTGQSTRSRRRLRIRTTALRP